MATMLLDETRSALDLSKREVPSEFALAQAVSRGLSVRSVDRLVAMGIPEPEIYHFIPRRTLERRRLTRANLTREESEHIERLAAIFALANAVFDDRHVAVEWLRAPKTNFSGERPIDLLHSHTGTKIVEETLLRAYFGDVA